MSEEAQGVLDVLLDDIPRDVLESIVGLVPLQHLVSARRTCRAMRNATDSVCRGRGMWVAADGGVDAEECLRRYEEDGSVVAALWLCGVAKASWLHHLACVGSPYQVAHALRLGEAVDGSRECAELEHDLQDPAVFLSPLMVACALGRREVVEVLLEASVRGWAVVLYAYNSIYVDGDVA